jgi:hypothetical protein
MIIPLSLPDFFLQIVLNFALEDLSRIQKINWRKVIYILNRLKD